ncbi:hypothetical protein L596_014261 [Steinernema carpocapsae]|uniref:Uncharacterized protein n=1 Tax=Steinernema carpocapsae TaxID=34508 RepID=A0A4U5NC79_STECR|nr:hypothetical protein L596_014261 [Steinernema carpocapsae]
MSTEKSEPNLFSNAGTVVGLAGISLIVFMCLATHLKRLLLRHAKPTLKLLRKRFQGRSEEARPNVFTISKNEDPILGIETRV